MTVSVRLHPHLYEINTWVWLEALSAKQGRELRLRNIPDEEWDTLQSLGFDLVWLMGIWQRSTESQRIARTEHTLFPGYARALPQWTPEDIVGSPYSIRAYEPDSRIGDWHDLIIVREKLHQRNIGLILDFVPNHTARDHFWIQTTPNWYVQKSSQIPDEPTNLFFKSNHPSSETLIAHGKDPYFSPWSDTAQLNYFHPDTRKAMLGELKKITQYCDGLRCDMAMLVLNRIFEETWRPYLQDYPPPTQEFWAEVRKEFPELLLIAEVYWDLEWELQQLGFDFTYDKRIYDRLCHKEADGIRLHLAADLSFQNKLVRFLENHDESRSANVFESHQLFAALTIMSTLPGMRLYHQGQLDGNYHHVPVQLRKIQSETINPHIHEWYKLILLITNDPLFHAGNWIMLQVAPHRDETNQNLIAYAWKRDQELAIVVVNMSTTPSQGRIIPDPSSALLGPINPIYVFKDLLSQDIIQVSGKKLVKDGIFVHMPPFTSRIYAH